MARRRRGRNSKPYFPKNSLVRQAALGVVAFFVMAGLALGIQRRIEQAAQSLGKPTPASQ